MYNLGDKIKELRKERNFTQTQLGDLLGVSEGTISKYESNLLTPPFETLRSIASFFNISMDTLCGMKYQGAISTHGLTESQTESLKSLIESYRLKNTQSSGSPTQEQLAVLGKIAIELTKKN